MCGRYNLFPSPAELQEFFDLFRDVEFDWRPRYNIAPTQTVLAIRFDEDAGPRTPHLMRWGLVPRWAKDLKTRPQPINARADGLAKSRMFSPLLKRKRCLIPATGFYEWRKLGPKAKQAYHIHREDKQPFAFAGLWDVWDRGDPPVASCTIITTEADELMQTIHDRMPVILHQDDYDAWLDPLQDDPAKLQPLLQTDESSELRLTPVSSLVNSYKNDSPECVVPDDV